MLQTARQDAKILQQRPSLPSFAAAALIPLLIAAPAWAYSSAQGEQVLKNVAGAAYIVLVCFFFYRLLRKRAYTGVTQVNHPLGSQSTE